MNINHRKLEIGYVNNLFTVYAHGVYPKNHQHAGQSKRIWINDFSTLNEATKAYPAAEVLGSALDAHRTKVGGY